MKKKIAWLVVSCLMVLALLVASCAKAEETTTTAPAAKKETAAPAAKKEAAAPAAKETAPAVKEAAPAVKEAASAALEKPVYGDELVFLTTSSPVNWDEAYAANWMISRNVGPAVENLLLGDWAKGPAGTGEYKWDFSGNLIHPGNQIGCIAESWEFPDDETIIFNIREGVHYAHNPDSAASRLVGGRELTADDVVWNEKRILWDPKTELYQTAGDARPLDVYATDKFTVEFKNPNGFQGMTWEFAGACLAIYPPEVAAKYGDFQKWENQVGTGPFMIKDYVPMSSATWIRNPNYYLTDPVGLGKGNQLPYLDTLKHLYISDMSTRMAAVRTGKIDIDYYWKPLDANMVINTVKHDVKRQKGWAGFRLWAMRLDNYKPGLPWAGTVPYVPPNPGDDDAKAHKVRRALNLAVNNPEMLEALFEGEGSTLSYKIIPDDGIYKGVYTPLDELPEDSRQLFEYHPDKAKQLLTEAGYPDGFKAQCIVRSGRPEYQDVAEMFKHYWSKIGVELELKTVTGAVYNNMWMKHTYEEMIQFGRSSYNPHVQYSTLGGATWNLSRVDDPVMNEYFFKMAGAYLDWEKKKEIMKEMNLYAIPKAYYVYWPVSNYYTFWQPWVKNYHSVTSLGVFKSMGSMRYVWIDAAMKKDISGR